MTREEFIKFIEENFTMKNGKLDSKKIKENEKILNLFYQFTDKIPNKENISIRELFWCIKNNYNEIPKCKTCGKEIPLKIEFANKRYPDGYVKRYCSLKCFNNDPEIKQKASEREKARAKERLKKRKKTITEKYGSWENRPGKENLKKANEKLKNKEIKEKRKEKTIKTNLEKYGTEWPTQTKEFQEKRQKTNLEKYGIKNPIALYSIKGIETYKKENIFKKFNFNEEQIKNWDNKDFWIKNFIIDNKINIQKASEYFKINNYMILYNHFKNLLKDEFSKYSLRSRYEEEIYEFLKSIYSGEIIRNDKKIISPYELDFYIPEKKLAIEFDGLFWHSQGLVNFREIDFKFYHLEKTLKAEEKDINLLHIFENEWIDPIKRDIWKSIISYKLGIVKQRYFARKLKVFTVDNKTINNFFDLNHIQGSAPSKVRLVLVDENYKIISAMTFAKPRYNRDYDWELIRFASLKYTSCVGCAAKLFKYFIENYKPKNIISYANRRFAYSKKNLYLSLGFKYLRRSEPNYYYFHENNLLKHYHRSHFQKHKLKNYKETKDFYEKSKPEHQIMFEAGFRRIFDCGQLVYEWKNPKIKENNEM